MSTDPQAILLMGVSGAGKTTVGRLLADTLHWPFYEGDDFHSEANRRKMAAGIPLNDADRQPWLMKLRGLINEQLSQGKSLILASSALKEEYRSQLSGGQANVHFVYLQGEYELIEQRLKKRSGHYMGAELLQSQFDALQPPTKALTIGIDQSPERIVAEIISALNLGE